MYLSQIALLIPLIDNQVIIQHFRTLFKNTIIFIFITLKNKTARLLRIAAYFVLKSSSMTYNNKKG